MPGVAVTVAPVAGLSPVVGDHEKFVPGIVLLAVNVAPVVPQTVTDDGETLTFGAGFTVTVYVAVADGQPLPDAVNVYVT